MISLFYYALKPRLLVGRKDRRIFAECRLGVVNAPEVGIINDMAQLMQDLPAHERQNDENSKITEIEFLSREQLPYPRKKQHQGDQQDRPRGDISDIIICIESWHTCPASLKRLRPINARSSLHTATPISSISCAAQICQGAGRALRSFRNQRYIRPSLGVRRVSVALDIVADELY